MTHSLALPLLRNLRQEALGYHLPLPHLPWLFRCVCEPPHVGGELWTNVVNTVVGIVALKYQTLGWGPPWAPCPNIFGAPCLYVSLALNALLTFMIVVWLSLHIRNIRAAMGGRAEFSGLYNTIITMFLESFALQAVASLLVIGSSRTYPASWNIAQPYAAIEDVSYQILAQTQVRAFQWPRPQFDGLPNMTMG